MAGVRLTEAAERRLRLDLEALRRGRLDERAARRTAAGALEVLDSARVSPRHEVPPHGFSLRLQVVGPDGRPQATAPATGPVWETDYFRCAHFGGCLTPVKTCLLRQEARHEGGAKPRARAKITRARALREKLGLSLQQMAARLGLSDETLRALESGTRNPKHRAGAAVRAKVAAALGCAPDELGRMEKAGAPPPAKMAAHYPFCASGACEQGKDFRARCGFRAEWAWARGGWRGTYHGWRPDAHAQREAQKQQRRETLERDDQGWMSPMEEISLLTPDDGTPY